ncbi:GAF and ANTAR domain-containing protein [Saccharopolyspora mangrovi]|uniref:GAF and ANTAR domain-containing protein n=1 Tax=Saccharopolyspora mangrovi TaxID=3082379 RepID=A0ABU6ADS6_9PSEU|nr:GAF and ANTAR domain-containing protein [Saccharopolyspora sp. S2-29]MEB3369701.1 GAF and ANTAR domain-containing protein [Saccharopolyspora sp. S2-29]
MTEALVDMADTLVDDYDVVDLTHRLASHCVDLLPVSAAGLMLIDERGDLRLLASSNEQARMLELFQLETDQRGPCLEAFHTGSPVLVDDLESNGRRWPAFAFEARRQGIRAVHALPLRLRDETVGALSLFSIEATSLSEDDQKLGQALADVATIGILQQRALARSETVIEQLQGALNSRVTIEQAKGVLAERGGIDVDAAFVLLRDYARDHRVRLSDLARTVGIDRSVAGDVLQRKSR